ncbi:MBL fold metallo-hydrolase [Inquilinus sp. OTU3971]|uniref:MBL fold metallo-hydrolase n=1 Tax=Inquilinus sp. OTU3971 TaxID=3043855 RepID=UPI00313AFE52
MTRRNDPGAAGAIAAGTVKNTFAGDRRLKRTASGTNFVRYEFDDLVVVALRDGHVDMPPSRLRQAGDRPFGSDMPAGVKLVDGHLRLSVNAFLVIDRDQYVLIDTGAANAWLPTMGSLLDALAEAGVARESIGTVALTHTHEDHVHGLVAADGSDAFPNLRRLLVPREEISRFDGYERLSRFRQARLPFGDGFKLSDSITAVQAHGHEVGHTAFDVSSGGETLLIWGDLVHVPSIQFERPELTWEYDANQQQARVTRAKMLERAAQRGVSVAGAHLDFPGVGHVERAGQAYRFLPL